MNHDYIEQHHVADRYLMGQLTPGEADGFEEHYLSCPDCLGRLERAESLQRGIKRAAAEDALRLAAARQAGFLAVLARLARSRQAGLALAALFVVLLLPGVLAYREVGRLGRELDRKNAELARRPAVAPVPDPAPAPVPGDPGAAAAREALVAEGERLRGQIAKQEEARAGLERQLSEARRPQVNTPILALSPERGGGEETDPTHRVRLASAPGWIVLSLELDQPEFEAYQATLVRGGKEVWKGSGLRPNDLDSLVVAVPAGLLEPGDYGLRVTGPGGQAVARFAFRAM